MNQNNQNTTREEMLKECMEYAVKNRWVKPTMNHVENNDGILSVDDNNLFVFCHLHLNDIIFSHAFCKAVFKDNDYSENDQELWVNSQCYEAYHDDIAHSKGEAWQFYIQQMAVADDPLLYMYNYIKNEIK